MKKYRPLLIYAPLILVLDHLTKYWVLRNIPYGTSQDVIPHFFDLVHFRNRGVAFSLFSNHEQPLFLYLITGAALAALLYMYAKTKPGERRLQIPLALILGGALGNLVDRLIRGEVIDFLYFHWYDRVVHFEVFGRKISFLLAWPAFNVADSAITCGALFLACKMLFFEPKERPN